MPLMKILILLSLLLSELITLSQPVILSTDMAPFGSSYNYKGLSTFTAIDTTQQGANQTWDFSTLIPDANPISTRTIFNPVQTIYADSFPTANYGILFLPNTTYRFYELNSTQLNATGLYETGLGYSYYLNPETQFVFPMSIGVNNYDTSFQTGTTGDIGYFINCIGWGTLLAPGHTYTNVIMMHYTYYASSGPIVKGYDWYDSSNGMLVFSYTASPPPASVESAFYLYNISSTINENNFGSSLFYNSPFHSSLNIKLFNEKTEYLSYELMNSIGEIIKTGQTVCEGSMEINFELENEPAGLYMLVLKDPVSPLRSRLLKLIKQ